MEQKKSKSHWKLIVIILSTIILVVTGIGVKVYMDIQKRNTYIHNLSERVERETNEFISWNYTGVKKVTVGKFWVNPASGEPTFNYTVYLNNGTKIDESTLWKNDNFSYNEYINSGKYHPNFKVPEAGNSKTMNKYTLQISDIKKLKKKGFTNKITGEEIKQQLKLLHPNRFKGENDDSNN